MICLENMKKFGKKVLGLIIVIAVMASCTDPQPSVLTDTRIINLSAKDVKFITFAHESYKFKDTIVIKKDHQYEERRSSLDEIYTIFPVGADSVKIVFENDRYCIYRWPIENEDMKSPLNIFSFQKEEIGKDHVRFTYEITEDDCAESILY